MKINDDNCCIVEEFKQIEDIQNLKRQTFPVIVLPFNDKDIFASH